MIKWSNWKSNKNKFFMMIIWQSNKNIKKWRGQHNNCQNIKFLIKKLIKKIFIKLIINKIATRANPYKTSWNKIKNKKYVKIK